jgi:hypothetical protein
MTWSYDDFTKDKLILFYVYELYKQKHFNCFIVTESSLVEWRGREKALRVRGNSKTDVIAICKARQWSDQNHRFSHA